MTSTADLIIMKDYAFQVATRARIAGKADDEIRWMNRMRGLEKEIEKRFDEIEQK